MPTWFSSLRAVVDPFIQICLLRRGPQDLPTSGILLGLALVAHTLMAMVFFAVYENTGKALLSGVLDTTLLALLTGTLLFVNRKGERLVQTLTALAGTGAIITLVSLPVSGWYHGAMGEHGPDAFAVLLLLILVAWSLAVAGHIFRHALSAPYFVGLVLAVAFYWISISVFRALFPTAG